MILQHRLKAKPIRPAIQVIKEYGDLPLVKCYSGQLNQVFMNLLGNAIDALDESNGDRTYAEMERHPNIIRISTEVKQEGKGEKTDSFAVIRIKDNGAGIAEATRCKIVRSVFYNQTRGERYGIGTID